MAGTYFPDWIINPLGKYSPLPEPSIPVPTGPAALDTLDAYSYNDRVLLLFKEA
jgi:hypothetical protein